MASVGIHVILGLTLPSYVPVFSNEAPLTRRTVQMLELSEADLSRLPDLSVPTVPPYIYQQTPLQSPFPPLPPLPSQDSLDSLPLDGNISVASPSQSFKIPSSSSSTPKRTRTRISLNQPSTPFPSMRRNLGIPVFPSQLPPPPPPGTMNPESRATETKPTPSIDRLAEQLRDDRNSSVLTNPRSKPPEPPRDKKEVALNPETDPAANQDDPTPNPEETASESDQSVAQKPNSEQQSDRTGAEGNKVESPSLQRRTLIASYPKAACQKQVNGNALYSVVVGTDGKPTNLQFIQGVGDPILEQKAQDTIQAHRFLNRTEQPQEYQVSVEFSDQDKVCPKPTPPEASEQTPEGSNSPAPQPENPEAAEESNSPSSSSSNPDTSDRDPENSEQPSPSDTTSESEAPKDQPEESANPTEESPEASNPPDVVVPTL